MALSARRDRIRSLGPDPGVISSGPAQDFQNWGFLRRLRQFHRWPVVGPLGKLNRFGFPWRWGAFSARPRPVAAGRKDTAARHSPACWARSILPMVVRCYLAAFGNRRIPRGAHHEGGEKRGPSPIARINRDPRPFPTVVCRANVTQKGRRGRNAG
jgi:hypothetical protein